MSNAPFLCLVWALTDPPPGIPGLGGPEVSPPIYHPGHPDHGLPSRPGGGHPDQGLPGGGGRPPHVGNRPPGSRPEYPSQGPVRPGRPVDPGWGVGSEHPDQGLPPGEDIPPDTINPPLPDVPPEYADKTIVAIKRPDEDWIVKAYDPAEVDNSLPPSGAQPK